VIAVTERRPRGICSSCGVEHALRLDGTVWHHFTWIGVDYYGRWPSCKGAGQYPEPLTDFFGNVIEEFARD